MSTNSAPSTFFDILGGLFHALFNMFFALLLIGVIVVILGTVAGGLREAVDRLRYRERYRVGRIIEYAKKLYPEYTAIEVKTKRNHDDADDGYDLCSCSAAVFGTRDGVHAQLMVVERWSQEALLSHLEKKIKEAVRRKEAEGEWEAEYEWRVVESAV